MNNQKINIVSITSSGEVLDAGDKRKMGEIDNYHSLIITDVSDGPKVYVNLSLLADTLELINTIRR